MYTSKAFTTVECDDPNFLSFDSATIIEHHNKNMVGILIPTKQKHFEVDGLGYLDAPVVSLSYKDEDRLIDCTISFKGLSEEWSIYATDSQKYTLRVVLVRSGT